MMAFTSGDDRGRCPWEFNEHLKRWLAGCGIDLDIDDPLREGFEFCPFCGEVIKWSGDPSNANDT